MRRPYISLAGLAIVAAIFGVWSTSAWSSTAHGAPSGASCATHLPHREKRNPQSTAQVLLPAGPTEVLLCRYMPSETRASELVGDRLGRAPLARTLAREFDELKPVPPGVYYCPAGDGAALYAYFRYKDSPEETVRVELSGCSGASNVRRKGGFYLSGSLKHRLDSLTAYVHPDA